MATPTDPSAARDRNSLRAVFDDGETLDVRISGAPLPIDGAESAPVFLRATSLAVTEEAPGRYLALSNAELGRGAMGRVYVAEDLHLGRQVAIKELLEDVNDAVQDSRGLQTLSRFLREARVTGALEHPNIVPVYELGRRPDGALYYTMRVVPGRTLAQAIADCKVITERLSLVNHFSGLCQAIAYAHSRNIVHRDIKPDNVMIGEFGETVVLDWGMAKRCTAASSKTESHQPLEPRVPMLDPSDLGLTQEGSLCGTPLYMSPEQASGRSSEVDQRSDVWSLGVVLYTILSGRPPFFGKSLLEIVAQVNAGRYTPLSAIDPQIPAELAAIVERALKPNRLERYPSARELARDVQAYQAGTRVAAYEYSSLDLVRRFVSRNRAAVTASTTALVVILALSFTAYRRVVSARDRAISAEKHALENELSARLSTQQARHSLGEVLLERAEQALLEGDSVNAELLAARALDQEEHEGARGVLLSAQSALRPTLTATLPATAGCTRSALSFSAGLFACARGRELGLWSLDREPKRLDLPLPEEALALAFASDASALALATSDGALLVRGASLSSAPWSQQRCGPKPTAVALTAGGQVLACGTARGELLIWRSGTEQRLAFGQAISALAFAKDGSELVVGGELGALVVYDEAGKIRQHLQGHAGTVLALALSEQGRYLASGAADRLVRFWDTSSGGQLQAPVVHSDAIGALGWSDDRRFLTLGGKDKTLRLLDLRTGQSALTRQHDDALQLAAISGDGNQLASYSRDSGLKLWTVPSARGPSELTERGNVLALALGGSSEQLLSAGLGRNGICIWNLATGTCAARLPVRLDRVRALAVSPDRQRLAVAGSGSHIFIWDLTQKIPTQVIEGLADETRALVFSLDGQTLAAAGLDRTVRVFDANSAALLRQQPMSAPVQTLSLSPDSGELLIGDQAGQLTAWSPKTGQVLAAWQAHADWVLASAISHNGALLASAGADRVVKIWDARSHKHLLTLTGHDGKVLSVDFSADSSLLASTGEDKSVRIWDTHTGRALATLTGHSAVVRVVRFTARPALLASGSDDGAIKLWHLEDLARPGRDLQATLSGQSGL